MYAGFRHATARWRKLPDFLIIGTHKGGTSSLLHYITQHPDVIRASSKEVHYFDGGLEDGIDKYPGRNNGYRAHFPLKIHKTKITGEATPFYLFHPLAPRRIHEQIPEARLIVLLRDPVARAISHYQHEVRQGRETRSITEAFDSEAALLTTLSEIKAYNAKEFRQKSYLTRGVYVDQLARYLQLFKRDQLLIIESKDLFESPINTLEQVWTFLGVSGKSIVVDTTAQNTGTYRDDIDGEFRRRLYEYYREPNDQLSDLLKLRMSWMD